MIEIMLSEEYPKQEAIMWLTNFVAWVTSQIVFNSQLHDVAIDRFIFLCEKPYFTVLLFCNETSQTHLLELFNKSIPLCYRDKVIINEAPTPIRMSTPQLTLKTEDNELFYLSE